MFWLVVIAAEAGGLSNVDLDRARYLARVYEEEAVSLVRLARLFADDQVSAEDIVQESFIRFFRSSHRIEDRAKAKQYLRSIVINLTRDHNRRGLMSLRHQNSMIDVRSPEQPDDLLMADESQVAVLHALQALSQKQRACLVLRYYEELSEKEIAEVLQISPNTVKTHCRRGLAALGNRLGEPE